MTTISTNSDDFFPHTIATSNPHSKTTRSPNLASISKSHFLFLPFPSPVGGVWPGESRNRFPAFHYIRRFIDSDSDFWHSCLLCDDINFSGFSFCRLRWRCPMTAFFLTDGVNGSERSMATFQYYSFGVWSHSSTNRQLLLFVDNHWCHTRTLMVVILINSRLGDILLLYRITLLLISVPLFLGIWFKVSSSA